MYDSECALCILIGPRQMVGWHILHFAMHQKNIKCNFELSIAKFQMQMVNPEIADDFADENHYFADKVDFDRQGCPDDSAYRNR